MYSENKDGFQVNNLLKCPSGQKIVDVSFTGCEFLLMREVKPALSDGWGVGTSVLDHMQTGTGPEREMLCVDFSVPAKTTWQEF